MNRNLARLGAITVATAAVAVAGTTQASAVGYSVSAANANGTVKAVASFNSDNNRFCVNLKDGRGVTAVVNGNQVQDHTADGDAVCDEARGVTDGFAYALDIRWSGTGGQGVFNTTRVVA